MLGKHSKLITAFFFVSLYSIAVETFLTRYFAVTNWAEYGYWIISIVMAGFAISGIVLSLFEGFFSKRAKFFISLIPPLLIVFTAVGLFWVSRNQFNPLEFQHEVMWKGQLGNICAYYAALFPVFFFLGLYIGLIYISNYKDISRIYAVNLIGSAIGSVGILGALYCVDLFSVMLVVLPLLLVPLVFSIDIKSRIARRVIVGAGILVFLIAELFFFNTREATFPFYKPITTALNVEDNRIVNKMSLPDGYFLVLENMLEFNNIDLSNNYKLLHMGPPPRSYGIYRDGRRVSSLMSELPKDFSYLKGSLDAFPYEVRKGGAVLIAGTNGGFRIFERRKLGAKKIDALETDPTMYSLIRDQVLRAGLDLNGEDVTFVKGSPFTYLMGGNKYDIIDFSAEFLGSCDNNKYSYTVDAVRQYLKSINDGGIISMPVSITEFTIHSMKLLETVRRALELSGVSHPEENIIVYRSNWTARILVSNKPFSGGDITALKKFTSARSFDTSYYKEIDPSKIDVWNELPAVSFEDVTQNSNAGKDAILTDAVSLLGVDNKAFLSSNFFNLEPSTIDRPNFFSILRMSNLSKVLDRRSILPQEEVGYLVNIFILVQALILAALILLLPLIRIRSFSGQARNVPKMMIYFASLGLGFLFIEMALIERFSLFLGNSTASFSIVLSGMLIFSGCGSYYSSRYVNTPGKGVRRAILLIALSVLLYIAFLFPLIQSAINLPLVLKGIIVLLVIAPVSFALGIPFPLGLSSLRERTGALLPWAWAINGAFSVISTPLANIISVSKGFTALFVISIGLYALAFLTFPGRKEK